MRVTNETELRRRLCKQRFKITTESIIYNVWGLNVDLRSEKSWKRSGSDRQLYTF